MGKDRCNYGLETVSTHCSHVQKQEDGRGREESGAWVVRLACMLSTQLWKRIIVFKTPL